MNVTRLFDILQLYKQREFQPIVFAGKENNSWKYYSSDQYIENSYYTAYAFIHMGIKPGDKIITITNNRPEWNFIDMGIMMCGAIHVPVYPTISDSDYKYILSHSEAKIIIVAGEELFHKIKSIAQLLPNISNIFTFHKIDDAKHIGDLLETGKANPKPEIVDAICQNINPDDVATIIYTSGTTGNPKGVMLSHANILSNVYETQKIPPPPPRRVLSFLPMCHVYERMMNYMYQYKGYSIYYVENVAHISELMTEVKPHIITTVPRLLESIYNKIMLKGRKLRFPVKQIFFWAVNLGLKFSIEGNSRWYNFQLKIARKLVFSKWHAALGNELDIIVSGGAALQPRLARIFWAAGFRVLEGYGLTETSPVIAVSRFEKNGIKFGTVGLPLENVQVKIAEDGEILTKGPHVMKGYYKEPELTKEVIDEDGWFHTGDIGVLEPEGQLRITDRKKEIFKTSAGKYIAPQVIENKLKESPYIEQVIVMGENQKYPAALIVPDMNQIKIYCQEHNIPFQSNETVIQHPKILKLFEHEIRKYNKHFGDSEQIVRFELLPESWSISTGELTPTLKLKRKFIAEKYSDYINKLFDTKK